MKGRLIIMESTLQTAKIYVKFFYRDGEWVDNPTIFHAGKEVDQKVCGFIRNLLKMMLESDYTSDATKMFLNSIVPGIKGSIDFYNNSVEPEKALDYITAKNCIQYDRRKIDKVFECDAISKCIENPESVNELQDKLNSIVKKALGATVQAQALGFDIQVPGLVDDISAEEFQELLLVLNRYSKRRLDALGKGLTDELNEKLIKYFNYLTTSGELSAKEKFYLSKVNQALGIAEDRTSDVNGN